MTNRYKIIIGIVIVFLVGLLFIPKVKSTVSNTLGGEITGCSNVDGNVASTTYKYVYWGNTDANVGSSTLTFPSSQVNDVNVLVQVVATGTNNPQSLAIREYSGYDQTAWYQGAVDWTLTNTASATVSLSATPSYQIYGIPTGTSTFAAKLSRINAPFTKLVFDLGTSTSVTSAGGINIKVCKE